MPIDIRLIEWQQRIEVIRPNPHHRMVSFPGLPPVAIEQDAGFILVRQSGRATAFGAKYVPPGPLYPISASPPSVQVEADLPLIWTTSWSYEFFVAQGTSIDEVGPTKLPATPSFEVVT
jgi:hypothetical protein